MSVEQGHESRLFQPARGSNLETNLLAVAIAFSQLAVKW